MAKNSKSKKSGKGKKAIFRSRLAACWGAFFDRLNIRYQYQQKSYKLGEEEIEYRPTFYIPLWDKFIEVKPVDWVFDSEEIKKWGLLIQETEKALLLLLGYPEPGKYNILPFIPYYIDGEEKCQYSPVSQNSLNTFAYGVENNQLYFSTLSMEDMANKKFRLENNLPLWQKWEVRDNSFKILESDRDSVKPFHVNIHALIGPLEKLEQETTLSRAYRAASRVRH